MHDLDLDSSWIWTLYGPIRAHNKWKSPIFLLGTCRPIHNLPHLPPPHYSANYVIDTTICKFYKNLEKINIGSACVLQLLGMLQFHFFKLIQADTKTVFQLEFSLIKAACTGNLTQITKVLCNSSLQINKC